MAEILAAAWPAARVGEAIALLAYETGMIERPRAFPTAPETLGEYPPGSKDPRVPNDLRRYLLLVADAFEVETEPQNLLYAEVEDRLRLLSPALFKLPRLENDGNKAPNFLAVLSCGRRRAVLMAPGGRHVQVRATELAEALRAGAVQRFGGEIDNLLDEANVTGRKRSQARETLLRERCGQRPVTEAWMLRLPPSAPVLKLAAEAGLGRLALLYFVTYIPKILFWMGSFWVLWRGTAGGQVDWGWLVAWAFMLYTNLPFRLLEPWYGQLFSVGVGWILKKRLLAGALRLRTEEVRHQGVGQLLSRTIESEAAENLTLEAGITIASHGTDVLITLPVLWAGAGGPLHAIVLLLWMALSGIFVQRFYVHRRLWTAMRLNATHDLVEKMVGHQTRLAQELPERTHVGEDTALAGYLEASRKMDRTVALTSAIVPGGWLLLSLLILTPAVVAGDFTTGGLAMSLGGSLFLAMSLGLIVNGLLGSADALVVWEKVLPLFQAAARPRVRGLPELAASGVGRRAVEEPTESPEPLIDASELVYGYLEDRAPVLDNCDLQIYPGDRVLVEGASGGGKSTLLSLILGLRTPRSGLLLLDGLDRRSLGEEGWRRRLAAAPQFHENHVFLNTFAFNLLLGREWPPTPEDFQAAVEICKELGLEDLLQRMPGGILQMVGETGWKLSHGERSRLFIARALLQRADLLGFDESFAALDPVNLDRALKTVLERQATVLVIAHP